MRRADEPAFLTVAFAAAVGLVLGMLGRGALGKADGAAVTWQGAGGREGAPGVDAGSPSEIPARGWWQVLRRVVSQFVDHRLMSEAAGITFYILLALFPALAALVSLYGLFADPAIISQHLAEMQGIVPDGGMGLIEDQVKRVASNGGGTLGFGLALGLATSLWSANAGIKALFDSLNVVYDEREKRSYVRLTLLSLGLTLGAILFLCLALAGVVALPVVLNFVGLGPFTALLLKIARWPVLLTVLMLGLAVVYRFGPSREAARWRWITWGSLFAIFAWAIVSIGFSWYVASFGSYNKTYGSLGAVVGFMTWIWLSAMVVLVGAELDAEMERQTAKDTTRGPDRPMGQRGAAKADQVSAV